MPRASVWPILDDLLAYAADFQRALQTNSTGHASGKITPQPKKVPPVQRETTFSQVVSAQGVATDLASYCCRFVNVLKLLNRSDTGWRTDHSLLTQMSTPLFRNQCSHWEGTREGSSSLITAMLSRSQRKLLVVELFAHWHLSSSRITI